MDKPKKPLTEEQLEKRRETYRRYAEKNREKVLESKRNYAKRWLQNPENKETHRQQNQRYYEKHRDEILGKLLTEEQREQRREAARLYQETHAEQHRNRSRKYAEEHREEVRERVRKWTQDNPEKVKAYYEKNREKKLEYNRQWKLKNPEKRAVHQASSYARHRSGRRKPGGNCQLCGNEETALARRSTGEIRALQQDHCHATGVLRGLLCLDCNRLLGAAKDNPELLRAAADYIERYRPAQTATDLGQAFNEVLLRGNHLGA